MDSQLETKFREAVQRGKLPAVGAIALDKTGEVISKGAYGTVNMDDSSAAGFTIDTPLLIFSCTKLVTTIAALQLIEQGKLKFEDYVEDFVPSIKEIQVLDGFDPDGQPRLREPKTKPTILNLLTHTTGLTYDFFDKDTLKWRISVEQSPSEYLGVSALANYLTPFRHDPGADYTYGVSLDFLGMAIEKVSGLKLNEYFDKHIIRLLGLKNTGLKPPTLVMHFKGEDGKLAAHPEVEIPLQSEVVAGGHFLTSTLADYSQILLVILNDGTHPTSHVKLLEEKTVKDYLFKDHIPQICKTDQVGMISSSIPQLSNEGQFLPSVAKGWSCGLMLNNEDVPNGRGKGSGAWAGLGNLYYWIDPKNGKLGMVASAVFPFFDTEVMYLFDAFERSVYNKDAAQYKGEKGSNYEISRAIEASA